MSEELRKKQIMSSLNQSLPVSNDPILNRLASERFAQDYSNMREAAYDEYVIPDPRVTGRADMDRSYILEAALLGAPLGRIGTAGKTAAKAAPQAADDFFLKTVTDPKEKSNWAKIIEQKQAEAAPIIAERRLQQQADVLLNEAKTSELVNHLNLQGQLTDILESAIKGERDRVDDILNSFIKSEEAKRAARNEINALAELLSGRSGGEFSRDALKKRLDDYLGMQDISMQKYLANPAAYDRVAGYPQLPYDITRPASRNEFGGRINVIKGR